MDQVGVFAAAGALQQPVVRLLVLAAPHRTTPTRWSAAAPRGMRLHPGGNARRHDQPLKMQLNSELAPSRLAPWYW